jgi:hypothetical protein
MGAIGEHLLVQESGADHPAPELRRESSVTDISGGESDAASDINIDFEEAAADRGEPTLAAEQKQSFHAEIFRESAVVRNWFGQQQWLPDLVPDLHVIVSARFKISKSLVPAWSGQRGQMEFPTSRVAAGKAAIAHELTHVYYPNANRLVAEGLALYVQAEIGSNPAFPNFGKPLHDLAREILSDIVPEFHRDRLNGVENLAPLHLADLDVIATPNPLTLTVGPNFYGEEARGQRVVYALAGSFATFLIATHGVAKFRELFLRTPLRPQACDAGAPGRWFDVYRFSLAELEIEWKSMIGSRDRVETKYAD